MFMETECQRGGVAIFVSEGINHTESQMKLCIRNVQAYEAKLSILFEVVKVVCDYKAPGANQNED